MVSTGSDASVITHNDLGYMPNTEAIIYPVHQAGGKNGRVIGGGRIILVDERSRRKQLSASVKSLEAKTTGNHDVQAELSAMRGQLVDAQQRTQFYESAPSDVANPRLAFIAAREIGAISEKGERVDWDLIRREMPELFRKVSIPTANAGAGAKQDGAAGTSMNDFIRTALSRQRG